MGKVLEPKHNIDKIKPWPANQTRRERGSSVVQSLQSSTCHSRSSTRDQVNESSSRCKIQEEIERILSYLQDMVFMHDAVGKVQTSRKAASEQNQQIGYGSVAKYRRSNCNIASQSHLKKASKRSANLNKTTKILKQRLDEITESQDVTTKTSTFSCRDGHNYQPLHRDVIYCTRCGHSKHTLA